MSLEDDNAIGEVVVVGYGQQKKGWKITLAKTALTISSILRTMDTVEQTSTVPASSP